jgi:hypothetical protein
MDYTEKYLKYKQKYIALKQYAIQQRGGNLVDENNNPNRPNPLNPNRPNQNPGNQNPENQNPGNQNPGNPLDAINEFIAVADAMDVPRQQGGFVAPVLPQHDVMLNNPQIGGFVRPNVMAALRTAMGLPLPNDYVIDDNEGIGQVNPRPNPNNLNNRNQFQNGPGILQMQNATDPPEIKENPPKTPN